MATDPYNQNASSTDVIDESKEVGPNCQLELASFGSPIPVTNVSFSEEADTSEVQYTSGFTKDIAVTGVTYSGSFDIDGNANNVRGAGWEEANKSASNLPKHVDNLVIKDSNKIYTFHDVLLNSHSKDIPSDDRTTQSFDFMAESMSYTDIE